MSEDLTAAYLAGFERGKETFRAENEKLRKQLEQQNASLCKQCYQTGYEDALEYASIKNIQKHIEKRQAR